jgi:hypothetical protein
MHLRLCLLASGFGVGKVVVIMIMVNGHTWKGKSEKRNMMMKSCACEGLNKRNTAPP